jgi:hypothetical protein
VKSNSDLVINEKQLKQIHNGFHANSEKRFIILSGLSGTGKTKWLQEYANVYCELLDLEEDQHKRTVSITPAFRDHTQLLGYLNPLTETPTFIEGILTQFLLDAQENPHLPYFLILDEMNLARVEFYLAPILSSMESDEIPIVFHESGECNHPKQIDQWPSNIFMAGTVNMDETTHAFSDKVLDRGFTMEFWDIDLLGFFAKNPTTERVQNTITKIYNTLQPVHLHFGYRTVKAIVDYVAVSIDTDPKDEVDALDQAIFSKVLPKIRGQQSTLLTQTLESLKEDCAELSNSKQKVEQMQHRLTETGLTRFWR